MTANRDRHDRVSQLYLQASSLDPSQRDAFLDRECGDDGDLREEVRSLLDSDDSLPEILRTGVIPGRFHESMNAFPESIGPYQIVERIGAGGMGEVFLAEQTAPIRRRVAIKVILRGIAGERLIGRFEQEFQALANMNHAYVTQIFDAGVTPDGRPYFVMEYVDGRPITCYCDRRRLGLQERIELFVKICEGVQHAHDRSIIHRDIKPSNILVTETSGAPTPKIIDFGVAKTIGGVADAEGLVTLQGELLFTPEYMSPEQAAGSNGEIDSRTDVYQLGLLFYELVCGFPPFDFGDGRQASLDEMRRTIVERPAPPPSAHVRGASGDSRALPGDLDAIALKALEKDPARRFQSPAELAEDLRRYLDGRPIQARPTGPVYRWTRSLLRKRVAVAAGLLLALFALLLVAQTRRLDRQRSSLAAERQAAAMVTAAAFSLLSSIPATANLEDEKLRVDLLVARIVDVTVDLPDARLDFIAELIRAEDACSSTVSCDVMEYMLERLIVLPNRDERRLLDLRQRVAHKKVWGSASPKGEELLTEIVKKRRRLDGPNARKTIEAELDLSVFYHRSENYAAATELIRDALDRAEAYLDPDDPMAQQLRGRYGSALLALGLTDQAIIELETASAELRRTAGADDASRLACLYNLAIEYTRRGEFERATDNLVEAIDRGFMPIARAPDGHSYHHLAAVFTSSEFAPLIESAAFAEARARYEPHAQWELAEVALYRGDDEVALIHLHNARDLGLRLQRKPNSMALDRIRRDPEIDALLNEIFPPTTD